MSDIQHKSDKNQTENHSSTDKAFEQIQQMSYAQNACVVLASASPRRSELLGAMGLEFEVIPADVDESSVHDLKPRELVERLSDMKAEAVKKALADGSVTVSSGGDLAVIAADTIVVYHNKIYGKPHTVSNALRMLGELNGRWHTVYTGVTVICSGQKYQGQKYQFVQKSRVRFKRMSDGEIRRYVETSSPLDKAGAYGIQDRQVVKKYRGSYSNIMGLPIEKLAKVLVRAGVIYENNRTFH